MQIVNKSFDWNGFLKTEYSQVYYQKISDLVDLAYTLHEIYPPKPLILNAFELCPFNGLKVVIIGQDPYHKAGQACGLSFSVPNGVAVPPSLKNIFKELSSDLPGFTTPNSGNLEAWAKQGVLLLNSVLTVQAGIAGSHKNFGWQRFTDAVINKLSKQKEHLVFLLWGNYAASKASLIDNHKHLILTAAHPSPLARGAFFGCKHFSKTNNYLSANGKQPIDWHLI